MNIFLTILNLKPINMKKAVLIFVILSLIVVSNWVVAQPSNGGIPLSFNNKDLIDDKDHIKITALDANLLFQEAENFEKNGQIYKIAELVPVQISINNSGTWEELEDGTKIWRLKISLKEAKGLALYYNDFYLPEHTQLFLYNENHKQVIGAFDFRNNPSKVSGFSTEIIQGETVCLELIQSPGVTEQAIIDIYQISYVYRGITHLIGQYQNEKPPGGVGSSQGCEININCSEGDEWQYQKTGVAEIFTGTGLCTGTVINNTSYDGTPYFLSADHCGGWETDFSGWQFYFHYESPDCEDPSSEPSYNTITGATKIATGDQNTGTDFMLLELNCTAADLNSIGVCYNGWSRGTAPSQSGVVIHHPAGDIKKISTYTTTVIESTFNTCPPNEHWLVQWEETISGFGVTEGGSSGAPLFNEDKLIVGTCSGGASYCGAPLSSTNDLFGKFDYHWESNGATSLNQLKPWLDPLNTGSFSCPGYYPGATSTYAQGKVFNDLNENCSLDSYEPGLSSFIVQITPGDHIVQTTSYGTYSIDSLEPGMYTAIVDTTNSNWELNCPIEQTFEVLEIGTISFAPSFGMKSLEPCSDPSVSINAPILRRCFANQQVYVQAKNSYTATTNLQAAYAHVYLPDLVTLQSSTLPYTDLGDNLYKFDIGDIAPSQSINWIMYVDISCDAVLNQTLCMEAELFPIEDCIFDDEPSEPGGATGDIPPCETLWDHSSLSVEGWCENDSVFFSIENTGDPVDGDMECLSPVRIYIDGVLQSVESIQLNGGETQLYGFPSSGETWRLEADQHPLHPGNSYPNAVVELCGGEASWEPGYVDAQYLDDFDPIRDIFCGEIIGSFDPNDKAASPSGVGEFGNIPPNIDLEYKIRFQNTGNDTAFTVVIKDTLDINLNVFTVNPGVASHTYDFEILESRGLKWTFNDILLVDSTTNEPASHGFVTFSVSLNPNLSYGTQIFNDAGIYFDFNEPVITNDVLRTVYDFNPLLLGNHSELNSTQEITVFPNPVSTFAIIEFTTLKESADMLIVNVLGEVVCRKHIDVGIDKIELSVRDLPKGMYLIGFENQDSRCKLIVN